MRKQITIVLLFIISGSYGQVVEDLFRSSDVQVRWLGIDFSHVKLIGDFSQFHHAGERDPVEMRNEYFPAWNKLILAEPDRYDLQGMLRKTNIKYDIDMIMEINSKTPAEELESYNTPDYGIEEIRNFVGEYPIENTEGIGVVLIAESLNKNMEEAVYHFVAMNMSTKEILIYERLKGEPGGFGLRNYWARTFYEVIKDIEGNYYRNWRSQYR